MKGPRNRALFDQGQRVRHEIEAILQAHDPLAAPLSVKTIAERLGRALCLRQVQRHLRAIRGEHTPPR